MGSGFTDHGLVFCRPDRGALHPERFSRTFAEQAVSVPEGDLRTNHPPHAPRRGLIVHLPGGGLYGRELGFHRAVCHSVCDNVGVAGLWWDDEDADYIRRRSDR
jgi:acetyl esterase/lipase